MLSLAKELGISQHLTAKLSSLDEKKLCSLRDKCTQKHFKVLKKEDEIYRLGVILLLAKDLKEQYNISGIDEKIYYDTLSDIKIWCTDNGIKNYGWLKNHLSFELFRLGRLQFQLFECKSKALLYNKLPFSYGEKLVYIHIPEGEKLSKEECIKSIKEADIFFKTYFPNHKYKYYFCESWLLYEGNRDFMDENSNIVKFMSLFNIAYSVKIDKQAIERIFRKRRFFKKNYPENTSLQKRAKNYISNGNSLGVGVGYILKNFTD